MTSIMRTFVALAAAFAAMFAYVDTGAFGFMSRRDRRRLIDFRATRDAVRRWLIERRIAFASLLKSIADSYTIRLLNSELGAVGGALEARNKARDLFKRAGKAREDEDKTAFDALWPEYVAADKVADELEGEEEAFKAAFDKYDGPPSEDRNKKDAERFKTKDPADAESGVAITDKGGGVTIVPFADKRSEGWIKDHPASVQHPEIVARLTPELREEAQKEVDAFLRYCRYGMPSLNEDQRKSMRRLRDPESKALQEGVDSEGGFLVPTDAVRLPIITLRGVRAGRIRGISSTFTTSRDGGDWPSTTDDVTWAPVGEEASFGESDPTLDQVPFTIRKIGRINKVSLEVLEDSAVDLPALLGGLFTRGLGRYEDQQAIEGDGTTEPLGLRSAGSPQGNVADITDLITLTGPTVAEVIEAFFELPEQWRDNAQWLTTSSFMAKVAAIESSGGATAFIRDLFAGPEMTLLGRPVTMFDGTGWDNAAAIGANEELGAFGDFSQEYFINRVGMTITRLDERFADTDQVGFKARARYDSFHAVADAFRIIKAAAS